MAFCAGQNLFVGDMVLPGHTNDSAEVAHVKGIQLSFVSGVCGPGFRSIKKYIQHAGFVDTCLCFLSKLFVVSGARTG